jgi:aryl-alcohol dehydrogenase-like predicted oxidoreductase
MMFGAQANPDHDDAARIIHRALDAGVGTLVWSPLAGGMLTGRYRKGQESDGFRTRFGLSHLRDERRLDVVEKLIPVAKDAGMSLTHLAMAFAIAHPGVTSAIIGPRTMEQLDDTLAGVETVLGEEVLDQIDAIVAPGTDVGRLDMAYDPPAIGQAFLRRRTHEDRTAA